jgi:hypothetical protein
MGDIRDLVALFSFHKGKLLEYVRVNEEKRLAERRYEEKYTEYTGTFHDYENQKRTKVVLEKARQSFAEQIKSILETEIQNGVNSCLPHKQYKVILKPRVVRNKNTLVLLLQDEQGRQIPPKVVEGDMLNQVLSFCAIVTISKRYGFDTIYYDEAFNSANIRSLHLIRTLISKYVEEGMTFVFVVQNPVLLYGLDRKVIEMEAGLETVSNVVEEVVEKEPLTEEWVDEITCLFDSLSKP